MLCTVVWEAYSWDERVAVWNALRSLLPHDGDHWSPKGLYVYWDPASHGMLYTGLANDLARRFGEHNGLVHHSGGNKLAEITAWFGDHPKLGFSVMLQAAGVALLDAIHEVSFTLGARSDDIIRAAEGQVIELHRLQRGHRPPWNGVGGAVRGQEWATESGRSVIPILTAEADSLFVARTALRDLAEDATAESHEVTIHGGRMHALMAAHEVDVRAMPEGDNEEVTRRLLKSFMLRSGHLIDDLTPSDAQIIERLRQIEDGRVLEEHRIMKAGLEQLMPEIRLPEDLEAAKMQYASALHAEFDHPRQAAAAAAVFESGYLATTPRLVLG